MVLSPVTFRRPDTRQFKAPAPDLPLPTSPRTRRTDASAHPPRSCTRRARAPRAAQPDLFRRTRRQRPFLYRWCNLVRNSRSGLRRFQPISPPFGNSSASGLSIARYGGNVCPLRFCSASMMTVQSLSRNSLKDPRSLRGSCARTAVERSPLAQSGAPCIASRAASQPWTWQSTLCLPGFSSAGRSPHSGRCPAWRGTRSHLTIFRPEKRGHPARIARHPSLRTQPNLCHACAGSRSRLGTA